ncbi:MAG: peptidoglycan DD-metalloendopeptidase family protein [Nocardioidaceae bacterium]
MLRYFPHGRVRQGRLALLTTVLAALLVASLMSASNSTADDDRVDRLEDRREGVNDRISDSRQDLHEVSRQLVRAQARVDRAASSLADARAELADATLAVREAEARDRLMQERLDRAVLRLENAREDLRIGRQAVEDKRDQLAAYAVSTYQAADSQLLDLGWSLAADSAGEALDDIQINDSIGDKQSVVLQELQANEVLLKLTEQRVEDAKEEVAVQRQEAADHLAETRVLRARAETARDNVADRLSDLRAERVQIAELKRQELDRLNALQADRERIEDTLREIAERRARQHRLSLRTTSPPDSGGVLAWPIGNTYITSPYGMRFHPILHIWKLHDGTDFGAGCGTPLYAPADGVVQSAYYNAGYGNRIIIDHGIVRGVSLWSSVNHLTSFAVRAGEQVSRGELIGYSGTTGYSTGCHLHFMVYVNGYTVDPMRWL